MVTEKTQIDEVMAVKKEELQEDRIGTILKNERSKKELELAEIAQTLCIKLSYLEAIEIGNYVELPPLPYSAGFVNAYAKYLGLNNERLTQMFKEELDDRPKNKNVIFLADDAAAEASLPNRRHILVAVFMIVLVVALWSILTENDEAKEVVIEQPAVEEVVVEEVVMEEVAETKEQPVDEIVIENVLPEVPEIVEEPAKKLEEKADQQVRVTTQSYPLVQNLEIKTTKEDTWIEIKDSNRVYLNKILKKGESYTMPHSKGLIISVGRYDGLEFYVDGVLTNVVEPKRKMNISLDKFLEEAKH